MKTKEDILEEFEKVLYESICIKRNDGKCDRSQERKLYVDIENISFKEFFIKKLRCIE